MAKALTDLSGDVLTPILDLIDAVSLLRLVIVGSSRLNAKIAACARSFVFIFPPKSAFFWPKCFHRFPALEHVSLRPNKHDEAYVVYEVDLMALPPTLRTLELDFCNALLSFAELPPQDFDTTPHVARLRPELQDKFKNLQRLTFSDYLMIELYSWDWDLLVEDLLRWPLVLDPWPTFLHSFSLQQAVKLPDVTYTLVLGLSSSEEAPEQRLPSSLTSLVISGGSTFEGDLLGWLPSNIQRLKIDNPSVVENSPKVLNANFASLALLQSLVSLNICLKTCSAAQMTCLPNSLRKLKLYIEDAEIESFAHFLPSLTALLVTFQNIRSTTTGSIITRPLREKLAEMRGYPLPDYFLPSMRNDIVLKLPQLLSRISHELYKIVRPKDWDALPRSLRTISGPVGSVPVLLTLLEHAAYVLSLPQFFHFVAVNSKINVPFAGALPQYVRKLSLVLRSLNLANTHVAGSAKEFDALCLLNVSILEAVSQRCPLLQDLTLDVDETFDFSLLTHVTSPLKKLTIHVQPRVSEDALEKLVVARREAVEATKVGPRCLDKLEHLTLYGHAPIVFRYSFPRVLASCKALQTLYVESEWKSPGNFRSEWIPLLPSSLVSLYATLDRIDVTTFKSLPPNITTLDSNYKSPKEGSFWRWKDLLYLPRKIRFVALPLPQGDVPSSNSVELYERYLEEISRSYFKEVTFSIGRDDEEMNPVYYCQRRPIPLQAILASEDHIRCTSPYSQQRVKEVYLDEATQLNPKKRKREE